MKGGGRGRGRGAAVFMLGFVLLNYPLLSIVAEGTAGGWPLLWLYLSGVWVILIGLIGSLAGGD